jgi:hypothetical protein
MCTPRDPSSRADFQRKCCSPPFLRRPGRHRPQATGAQEDDIRGNDRAQIAQLVRGKIDQRGKGVTRVVRQAVKVQRVRIHRRTILKDSDRDIEWRSSRKYRHPHEIPKRVQRVADLVRNDTEPSFSMYAAPHGVDTVAGTAGT